MKGIKIVKKIFMSFMFFMVKKRITIKTEIVKFTARIIHHEGTEVNEEKKFKYYILFMVI